MIFISNKVNLDGYNINISGKLKFAKICTPVII